MSSLSIDLLVAVVLIAVARAVLRFVRGPSDADRLIASTSSSRQPSRSAVQRRCLPARFCFFRRDPRPGGDHEHRPDADRLDPSGDMPEGTLRAILKQAGIESETFSRAKQHCVAETLAVRTRDRC
jgi:hypothetical protein